MRKFVVILITIVSLSLIASCKTTEKVVYVDKPVGFDIEPSLKIVLETRPVDDYEVIEQCKDLADVVNNSIVYLMQWQKWEEYSKRLERYLAELRVELISL